MAAGIAAIAVGLAVSTRYERRLEALGQEAAALKAELERQASVLAILRDPATQVVALNGLAPSPTARARMMWHEKAGGILVATGLPPAPEGKAYQLLGHRRAGRSGSGRRLHGRCGRNGKPAGVAVARRERA